MGGLPIRQIHGFSEPPPRQALHLQLFMQLHPGTDATEHPGLNTGALGGPYSRCFAAFLTSLRWTGSNSFWLGLFAWVAQDKLGLRPASWPAMGPQDSILNVPALDGSFVCFPRFVEWLRRYEPSSTLPVVWGVWLVLGYSRSLPPRFCSPRPGPPSHRRAGPNLGRVAPPPVAVNSVSGVAESAEFSVNPPSYLGSAFIL